MPVQNTEIAPSIMQQASKEAEEITAEVKIPAHQPEEKPYKDAAYSKVEQDILKTASLILPMPIPPEQPPFLTIDKPKIALVIDDLGLSHRTQDVIDLPFKLTLAFLPDPKKSPSYAKQAADKGHEIIVHMPMEAMNFNKEERSILRVSMNASEVEERLDYALNRIPQAIGINNHTGSKYTSDEKAMARVLSYMQQKELLFLDSKTISSSKAKSIADGLHYPILERSVFIDHYDDRQHIDAALSRTERWASKNGYAIAIGHPYDNTIAALEQWLPSLKKKGFEIVTLNSLLKTKTAPEKASLSNIK